MGKGRSAVDAVWRAAVLAEAAAGDGMESATNLQDMTRFYERIDHGLLAKRALQANFDPKILRVCLQAYRGPRFVRGLCQVAPGVAAHRGIPAGCPFATTFVRIYVMQLADEFCAEHPHINLDVFVDDWAIDAKGERQQVVYWLGEATKDLSQMAQDGHR